ncbi:MAG: site-specific DNA-methyltransferase [Alphaproteobacteria bacterium]|nr:site-specific DNA-methyltransferase [Alphaproteobacteria bacterium]
MGDLLIDGRASVPPQPIVADYQTYLAELEAGSVDLLLTDPPYAISRDTGFSSYKKGEPRFAVSMDFGKWDHEPIDLPRLATLGYRALRRGGTVIVWYDFWKITDLHSALTKAGFAMLRLVIWQKSNPVPLNQRATYLSNSREVAVVGVKVGRPTFNATYHNGVYDYPIPRGRPKRLHPTQKPLRLFEDLVCTHSNEGDLVIDPFCGSGTTLLAAAQHQRKFGGCDIDPHYVSVAGARLADFRL